MAVETIEKPIETETETLSKIDDVVVALKQDEENALNKILGFEAVKSTDTGEKEEIADSQEDSAEGTTAKPGESLEGYDKAMVALKRVHVDQKVIDSYADDPEALVAWGLKLAKNQADVDGYGNKIKDLESKLGSGADETKEGEDKASTSDVQLFDPEVLTRSESELSDVLGEDAAKAIMAPMRELLKQVAEKLDQQGQVNQHLQDESQTRRVTETRASLRERFPRLDDDDDFGHVLTKMDMLAKTGEYHSVEDLMTDSYRLLYAEDIVSAETVKKRNAQKNRGQPTSTTKAKTPSTSKTIDERDDAALDVILAGKGVLAASEAYGSGL